MMRDSEAPGNQLALDNLPSKKEDTDGNELEEGGDLLLRHRRLRSSNIQQSSDLEYQALDYVQSTEQLSDRNAKDRLQKKHETSEDKKLMLHEDEDLLGSLYCF